MVDTKLLLADLKKLRKQTEDDLRRHHRASPGRAAVEAEWREAFDAKRTADTFETFWSAALDQAAVHWLLALVFLRFLEDNSLLDRPLLSGPGERLELAELRQREFFRARPHDSDTEYLQATFDAAAKLPGLAGLYDSAHNPLFRLPLSGDGAMVLLAFFRARAPDTGELMHDFTDPDWTTRFLGDLYQDLSDDAKKRYALLQTPDFVEEWILSRTLDPAIGEFGYEHARMIDPTCGSGHFLLGGFARMLAEWQRHAPDMPSAAQAQKALDAVAGVDLNPFAVEIARFRLLLAALRAAGETRLAASPDFRMNLAVGDSLIHGTHFSRGEFGGTAEGFGHVLPHYFGTEDGAELGRILGKQYHAVVGNPPYITPKDAALRDAYRGIYGSCHMNYSLVAPFVERFFELALIERSNSAGFVGLIVSNSFLRREFGEKLVENVLTNIDVSCIVDCSRAYIPGHGTPTIIIFGRNRRALCELVRLVVSLRGEKGVPQDPSQAPVWQGITKAIDLPGTLGVYAESMDYERRRFFKHPVFLGASAEMRLVELLRSSKWLPLSEYLADSGRVMASGEDDFFFLDKAPNWLRNNSFVMPFSKGDNCRDWFEGHPLHSFAAISGTPVSAGCTENGDERVFWPFRASLRARKLFGRSIVDIRGDWRAFSEYYPERRAATPKIAFPLVATHNHFVPSIGTILMNHSSPVLVLRDKREVYHLAGILNSSTACFWMKSVFYPKGGDHVGQEGARVNKSPWDERYEFSCTGIAMFPVAASLAIEELSRKAVSLAERYLALLPESCLRHSIPTQESLAQARQQAENVRNQLISVQEEIDWASYRSYGICEGSQVHAEAPSIRFGERAFEIILARRQKNDEADTEWFIRHNATPVETIPEGWPQEYRDVVERRIELIESDPFIGVLERPDYKRRWSAPTWEEMEQEALRAWLLDRLEDARHWPRDDPRILSTNTLADSARRDADFLSLAALYVGRDAFDLEALVADLVARESVPFLARQRYSETGLRKRADWEATWQKQRAEDAIDADLAARRDEFVSAAWARRNPRGETETPEAYAARMAAGRGDGDVQKAADAAIAAEAKRRKREEVGDIAVPPKYRTPDFLSQDFWRLRGGLDVPKERFVSFPHAARDADPALPVLWAGHDHLARAKALAAWYVDRKDTDGWAAPRLTPLLAGLLELVPWLIQWHNDIDPGTGLRMGAYFAEFVDEEARGLGLTLADLRAWTPPTPVRRARRGSQRAEARG